MENQFEDIFSDMDIDELEKPELKQPIKSIEQPKIIFICLEENIPVYAYEKDWLTILK